MIKRTLLALAAAVALGGCNSADGGLSGVGGDANNFLERNIAEPVATTLGSPLDPLPTMGALEVISIVNTEKTMGDHIIGWVSGKDCSTIRAQADGPYCEEKPEYQPPAPPRTLWCYRSLAGVNCYDRPTTDSPSQFLGADSRSPTPIRTR